MNIGTIIKKRRQHLNLSKEELAQRLNVSRSAISNWEIGRNYPDIQTLVQLSDELNLSLDQLLKQDNIMTQQLSLDPKRKQRLTISVIALIGLILFMGIIAFLFYPKPNPTITFVKQTPPTEGYNSSGLVPLSKEDIQELQFDNQGNLSVKFTTTNDEGVASYMLDGDTLEIHKYKSSSKDQNTFDAVITADLEHRQPLKTLKIIVK